MENVEFKDNGIPKIPMKEGEPLPKRIVASAENPYLQKKCSELLGEDRMKYFMWENHISLMPGGEEYLKAQKHWEENAK